jgi:hypothetical protein
MDEKTALAIQDIAATLDAIGLNRKGTMATSTPGALEFIAMELTEIKKHLGHISYSLGVIAERDQ